MIAFGEIKFIDDVVIKEMTSYKAKAFIKN